MRALLVEDDALIALGLLEALHNEHIALDHLSAAKGAEQALQFTAYDLAIIDLGLPDMDGLELIRRLRAARITVPMIILTAHQELDNLVTALDGGADDYLTKPFLLPELLARIRALIRRSHLKTCSTLRFGPLMLHLATHQASCGNEALTFSPREWDVLEQLLLAAPKVVAKQKLVKHAQRLGKRAQQQRGGNLHLPPARQAGTLRADHPHGARHRLPPGRRRPWAAVKPQSACGTDSCLPCLDLWRWFLP